MNWQKNPSKCLIARANAYEGREDKCTRARGILAIRQQVSRKGSSIEGLGYKKKGKGHRMKTQGNQAAGYICFIPMTPRRHLQLLAVTVCNRVFPISLPKTTKPSEASWSHHKPKPKPRLGNFTAFLSPQTSPKKVSRNMLVLQAAGEPMPRVQVTLK